VRPRATDLGQSVAHERSERFVVESFHDDCAGAQLCHHGSSALPERPRVGGLAMTGLTRKLAARRAAPRDGARRARGRACRAHGRAEIHQREQAVATLHCSTERTGLSFRFGF
jgi:hypothetical protein